MKEPIPVVFCSDNNFAAYLSVTIRSLASNTQSNLLIYIFDFGISYLNKFLIRLDLKSFKNIKIRFIKINYSIFKQFPVKDGLTLSMYGRYLIPDILMEHDKIIYSDIDVAFTGDIKKLYQVDLEKYPLGAVPSQRFRLTNNYDALKKKLSLSASHKFFMSGLLVFNSKIWREGNFTEKLLKITEEFSNILTLPGQEVLNKVFDSNYKELQPIYCVIYKIFNSCYHVDERKFLDKNKIIIHYPGKGNSKPWNNKNLLSGNFWWKFAKESLFYNKLNKSILTQNNITGLNETIISKINKLEEKINSQEHYIEILNKILQYYIKADSNIIYINNNLRKLQDCDVLALSIFQKVCRQNKISFWLDFGTLLGAVRNSGFIPWDDDIDLGICREDYDRIGNGLYREFEKNGLNVNFGSFYYFKIIRLTYKDQPIQIDLWPYDYCESPLSKERIITLKKEILNCLEEYKKVMRVKEKFYLTSNQSDLVRSIQNKLIWNGRPQKKEFGLFSGCDSLGYNKPRVFYFDWVFPLKYIKFENLICPIPNKSDEYLRSIYGDYNLIPNFSNSEMLQHENIQNNLPRLDWEFDELKKLNSKI